MNCMQIFGFTNHLSGLTARFLEQHFYLSPDHSVLNGALLFRDQRLQALQPVIGDIRGDLFPLGGRRAGSRRVFERIGIAVFNSLDQIERCLKVVVRFFGKADDKIT